ncbi:hypothetical protein DSO57_1007808 [Entomophthora muscae]|uniref:Uncharacterized protein n=1 Tax=Entomophthora muscae TaxID=34485 RepID=A0ACC2S9A5_9FUNG|nr:hypothetical protein DSO57_1007808 [Entomophthora muscae]
MAPSFTLKEIDSLCNVIHQEINVMTSVIKEKLTQPIDMYSMFRCLTLDLIGVLGFGQSFNTLTDGPHDIEAWLFRSFIRSLVEITFPLLKHLINPPKDKLQRFTQSAIDNVRSNPNQPSIMASLIAARDPESGDKLTDKELIEEALLQISAGSDSTANTMTWALYLILKHPQVNEKLTQELFKYFPSLESPITLAECKQNKLPYLDAVIKESMRVLPTAAGSLERVVPSGGREIDGHFLPEGVRSNNKLNIRLL